MIKNIKQINLFFYFKSHIFETVLRKKIKLCTRIGLKRLKTMEHLCQVSCGTANFRKKIAREKTVWMNSRV